jgi:DNA modification methylase
MSDRLTILQGDCLEQLRTLPDESVHCCVSSPPYWGLRDYGHAGQIGLEPTPEEYVAKLVSVFSEVRRVLRKDGTLWLNLGDSYAQNGSDAEGGRDANRSTLGGGKDTLKNARRCVGAHGLKPKDLCGIPWRVAQALQAPHYTGRIKDVQDRIWLAAMIDAEGCMFIHKRKAGSDSGARFTKADGTEVCYERTQDTYGAGLEVANTSLAIIERCLAIVGKGSICSQSPSQNNRRKQTIYRWNLRTSECRDVVREIYPHLVAKQHQARLLCACPSSGEDADSAHQSMIALHNGGTATIDFKEPASMFVPGWYLRSDIIWSKANPMPESVTDRPTKAHEYIFLLSKSERYWYDAEAIKEAGGQPKPCGPKNDASRNDGGRCQIVRGDGETRNKRTVWTVPTAPYSEAHFATFPPDLIKPCILAGCPAGGTVLDPFGGSGTTGTVALELGRKAILIELNPAYVELIEQRTNVTPGLALA